MAKSSQIIKTILKDIQKFVREIYDSEGLETVASDITTDKQLFTVGTVGNSAPGWINTENMSSLIISHQPKDYIKTIYPALAVAIMHRDVYSFSTGDILLQGKTFGSLMEPGIIDRLKKCIKHNIKSWAMNAKL